jgi:hypothetical protein
VLALSDRLRADGVDCILDQYIDSPPEGWPRWMDRQIQEADFVLMICTPTYYRRVMGKEEPGTGYGVMWESALILQYIYNQGTLNTQFIPILLEGANLADIPTPLQSATHYRLSTTNGYEELYRRLTHQPGTLKPILASCVHYHLANGLMISLLIRQTNVQLSSSKTYPIRATPTLPDAIPS